ncbi:MAG TPA: hypothetical protein VLI05_02615 [Candidatus Saccharimonadia bacterium]|nr:hypothetical protein [Candidatus Saccharimonadia bacterium]
MLTVVAMAGLCIQPLAIPASADPIVTVVAGTGTDGPLVDGQPAAQSQLWGDSDVAVTSSGTTLVVDTYHHEVRQITASGVFQAFLGNGTAGCDPDGHLLSQPRGIVSDGHGGAYVANTLCGQIVHRDASGVISVMAGHYNPNGNYTQAITPGMSATQAFLTQPAGLAYDAATDTLYIADQYSSRVLKVTNGQIWVVAGTGSNGYNGDELPATSAQLNYPVSVAFHGGQLYIGDSSNARIRRVDAAGTIHTLMGTGNTADTGDGGPAASASLSGVGGLAFAADGTLYAMAHSSGQIWSVTPDGVAHTVVNVHACADGLALDTAGNLIVASACAEYVLRVTVAVALVPTVQKIEPAGASVTDPLLTRGVYLLPLANGAQIDHYEYAWTNKSAAVAPSTPLQRSTGLIGRLDYRDTTPDSDWYLLARAVAPNGETGPWSPSTKVHTPPKPKLLFGFDSVTSGHHNDYGDKGKTTCDDPNYGYAPAFAQQWLAALPSQWREQDQVLNLAHSGFALEKRPGAKYIQGTVLDGGKNACGQKISVAPLAAAQKALATSAGSWSRLVATGGINGTNWPSVVTKVVQQNLLMEQVKGRILAPNECGSIVGSAWDGAAPGSLATVTDGVHAIVQGLRGSDPTLQISWMLYYNSAGTGTNRVRTQPYVPITCEHAFDVALGKVQRAISAGLPADVQAVPTDPVMREDNSRVQPLFALQQLRDGAANPAGWPHPNQAGGEAIAGLLTP